MAQRKESLPGEIGAVQGRFEAWRAGRERGARIPEALWQAAIELAGKHGVHKTAQALRLDYMVLKRRISAREAQAPARRRERQPAFVDVTPAGGLIGAGCVIELEDDSGGKVRIRLARGDAAELGAFARAFLRGER